MALDKRENVDVRGVDPVADFRNSVREYYASFVAGLDNEVANGARSRRLMRLSQAVADEASRLMVATDDISLEDALDGATAAWHKDVSGFVRDAVVPVSRPRLENAA